MDDISRLKFDAMLNNQTLGDYGFQSVNGGWSSNGYGIQKGICQQLNEYFVKTGIIIVILYIVLSWFLWWFFKYGYKILPKKKYSYIGNLEILETRVYWDTWIRSKITKVMLGYIIVNIWFNL